MQNTTNFNLKKPEGTDIYDIQNENDNMDIIDAALDKAHSTDDSASTDLVDGDYIPFYDVSATAKKKALWSTIIAKLKNIFPMGSTLAPIANGPKYPGTWSAGKQFVYQGLLYKTKVNVTSSDNINVGTGGNAELASDITSQISNLASSQSINLGISDVSMYKYGKVIVLCFKGATVTSSQIGVIPSAYTPPDHVYALVRVKDSSNKYHAGLCTVQSNRELTVSTFVPETGTVSGVVDGFVTGSITYVLS